LKIAIHNVTAKCVRVLLTGSIAAGALTLFSQTAFPQDTAKITAGEGVYSTYCSTCHGEALVSSGQVFDLRRLGADARPRFDTSVRMGKGQMPPWKGVLTDEEFDQIWHYIQANALQK
jgi:mono/diheme cytochrome c family protein